jgi:hypothetical protein
MTDIVKLVNDYADRVETGFESVKTRQRELADEIVQLKQRGVTTAGDFQAEQAVTATLADGSVGLRVQTPAPT